MIADKNLFCDITIENLLGLLSIWFIVLAWPKNYWKFISILIFLPIAKKLSLLNSHLTIAMAFIPLDLKKQA